MRRGLIVFLLALCSAAPAFSQVGFSVNAPGLSIGINVPTYPQLVAVPGYPVYYAPGLNSNYFFYDGMYWVYANDNWYSSSWYNGPWGVVEPAYVPVYLLRVPVRYYRHPPAYFRGWRADLAPRWGDHWGRDWEQRRAGWDRWDRRSAPAPAPLPYYQRQYSGNRYPHGEQQQQLNGQYYRHQPSDEHARQQWNRQAQAPQYNQPNMHAQPVQPPQHQGGRQFERPAPTPTTPPQAPHVPGAKPSGSD